MNTDGQVVVGYDGSPDSLAALAWAATMASLRGEAIVATTVVDPRENPRGVAWPESWWDEAEEQGRKELAPWPGLPARFERPVGHLAPTLVESARGGSMLVVGSKGHGLVGEILRGSVSQSAARHASVPVVVVRASANTASGRIVVGADGSESSARAIDFACEMARQTGDKVVALRAWHPATAVADRYGYLPPATGDTIAEAESALDRTVDRARTAHRDVAVEGEVYSGAAERGLVEASSNASLVVVGSRGRAAVAGALMGSVSQAVLHKASCPIAVVH
jgi:nucleotide-binding universal stress UspA family protein